MTRELKAPMPWFGGKSSIAHEVWSAFGPVQNYVEPFFGSGAVLLARPGWPHDGKWIETVNDADGFISNFWRALSKDPDGVSEHADWPVNENDLEARHSWLIRRRVELTEKLTDPDFYDSKIAGWWVWGCCSWIGSGWCSGRGPWVWDEAACKIVDGRTNGTDSKEGVWKKLPHLGDAGQGINRQLPHLGDAGRGINRQLPHLGNAGQGINRQLPHLGNAGQGIRDYLGTLADRLRHVRVCCGDWSRVCGPTPTVKFGLTGVFLDPPYADEAERADDLYAVDCGKVAHDVREWAVEWGNDPRMRIALCGYDGEHKMPDSWRVLNWKTRGGYESQGDDEAKDRNCHRERIFFSPHCLNADPELFA